MTVKMAENVIQLTQTPVRCSSCFNQEPRLRHIDMDAACDRGYGDDAAVKIAYDDLILCENCVREAATLLDMVPRDDTRIQELEHSLDLEHRRARQAETYAKNMEEALASRPEKVEIDHRKKPRPLRVVEGPIKEEAPVGQ